MSFESSLVAQLQKPPYSVYDSIDQTIGGTPIVKLQRMAPEGVDVYVKLEAQNPGGSVKDRMALSMIEWAEQTGRLKPGQTVIEATSGNTGIGLAMVCAAKGYPFVAVMAESFSVERRKLMRFLGAQVVLTNKAHKASGMVIKTKELADKHGFYWPNQFESQANSAIHEQTTGPEIVDAMQAIGKKLDHIVVPYGTGGTVKGVGKILRERSPETQINICEPASAPMLFSNIKTQYNQQGAVSTSFAEGHPVWRSHPIQGWATDFIPKLVDDAVNEQYVDNILHANPAGAMATSQALAKKEGIFTGTSGGGVLYCALELAKTCEPGTCILATLADTGERYISTPLFADVPAEMTEEEEALLNSTPSALPPPTAMPGVLPEAMSFVEEVIASNAAVVWSMGPSNFRLLDDLEIPYESINLYDVKYAKDNNIHKYRLALSDLTGCVTFPQVFLDGKFIGAGEDVTAKWKNGDLIIGETNLELTQ